MNTSTPKKKRQFREKKQYTKWKKTIKKRFTTTRINGLIIKCHRVLLERPVVTLLKCILRSYLIMEKDISLTMIEIYAE